MAHLLKSTVLLVVAMGLLCLPFLGGCSRQKPQRNSVRPDGFPDALVAPEYAYSLSYSSSTNQTAFPHTHGLSFFVDEPYPPERMRTFIEESLSSKGWRRLKYRIMAPGLPGGRWLVTESPPGRKVRRWQEDWINDNGDMIFAFMEYSLPGNKDIPSNNAVYVYLDLFEKDSWMRSFASRYKELHPEEFSKDGAFNQERLQEP